MGKIHLISYARSVSADDIEGAKRELKVKVRAGTAWATFFEETRTKVREVKQMQVAKGTVGTAISINESTGKIAVRLDNSGKEVEFEQHVLEEATNEWNEVMEIYENLSQEISNGPVVGQNHTPLLSA